jgi:hypothetical protein
MLLFVIWAINISGHAVHAQTPFSSVATELPITVTSPSNVTFDDHVLFKIYSNGNEDAQYRAELVNQHLNDAWLEDQHSHGQLANSEATVSSQDGMQLIRLNGAPLLYVTQSDAANAGVEDDELATDWAQKINSAFAAAMLEKQPEYARWALRQAVIDIVLGASVFIIVFYVGIRFKLRRLWPLYLAIIIFDLHRVAIIFPGSRRVLFAITTNGGLERPIYLIAIISVFASAIIRIWSASLHLVFPPLPEHISSQDLIRRTNLRRRTLAGVAEVTGASLIWIVAGITVMSQCGLNLSSLLTSAGLIGVALGLVAQDSIRDTLAGIYILADDRYGMGDIIHVGDYEGRVERFNLRMTQIRDMSGRLITLSNRSTTEVANLTARWAQVDFRIGVSYYENLDHALDVLITVAKALADEWPNRFLEPPELIGVDSFNDLNITLRLIARTPPGDQSAVAHELRKRAKAAFDKEGIAIINEQHNALKSE